MEGSLIIVGTGLRLGHVTLESKSAIEQSKKLLYLVSDPITISYLEDLNKTAESLFKFYAEGKDRLTIYNEIIEYIMKTLEEYKDVCVVFYGHPGVFTYPSHIVIQKAKELGYSAIMYPGVSTEDMIFSDLGIDPAIHGLQSFEVTQFLDKDMKYDPRCYLILWQIGVIGKDDYSQKPMVKEELNHLKGKLLLNYPKEQKIIFYVASNHKLFNPTIIKTELSKINSTDFNPVATLIVTPNKKDNL